ncbi:MAG TPA: helix-turn-helix transcriptional regulator [Candidatus Competibacteraceae bacterium]|nr:helix-turn-helix transcriptional regulator [Candidatus Competibacteraceae bacterium]HSA47346.1 helix-turn-helix transcriptional regulator [Candidatus Competibacteraceae bacterium]
MTDFLEHWADQSDANAKLVAQERFITEVTETIWKGMEESGINKTDLANRMGATKGYVSQVLSGSRNMTLRTLADICFALDLSPKFRVEMHGCDQPWESLGHNVVAFKSPQLRYAPPGNVIMPEQDWPAAA